MKRVLLALFFVLVLAGCAQRSEEAKRILATPPEEASAEDIARLLLELPDRTAQKALEIVQSPQNPTGRFPEESYRIEELQYIRDFEKTHAYSQVYDALHAAAMGIGEHDGSARYRVIDGLFAPVCMVTLGGRLQEDVDGAVSLWEAVTAQRPSLRPILEAQSLGSIPMEKDREVIAFLARAGMEEKLKDELDTIRFHAITELSWVPKMDALAVSDAQFETVFALFTGLLRPDQLEPVGDFAPWIGATRDFESQNPGILDYYLPSLKGEAARYIGLARSIEDERLQAALMGMAEGTNAPEIELPRRVWTEESLRDFESATAMNPHAPRPGTYAIHLEAEGLSAQGLDLYAKLDPYLESTFDPLAAAIRVTIRADSRYAGEYRVVSTGKVVKGYAGITEFVAAERSTGAEIARVEFVNAPQQRELGGNQDLYMPPPALEECAGSERLGAFGAELREWVRGREETPR